MKHIYITLSFVFVVKIDY